jgi:NAD(P)-dependent dehydrogenase (short-subunit alcohol dehydrogenase family)
MSGICEGRVAIVTGAGRGLGREHALELARQGARVIVNDLGSSVDGSGSSAGPANEVVEAIRRMGAEAVVNADDVSNWDGARGLVETAIEIFGGLDVLVNNAGILRDRMLVNMTPEEWDDVIRVHLRGTVAPTHWAARYWRDRAKEGKGNDARVICTSSSSGIYGNVGQTNYGAAKAGIASFAIIASKELARYGVTVNAIAPGARTRMTEELARARGVPDPSPGAWDPRDPANVAPLIAWLASNESAHVTGRVFNVAGGRISVAEGWHAGPGVDKGDRWQAQDLGPVVTSLVEQAAPNAETNGRIPPLTPDESPRAASNIQ